ncbi:MAG: HAD domain-containing protein [Solirubrobacteraceae bacterium]
MAHLLHRDRRGVSGAAAEGSGASGQHAIGRPLDAEAAERGCPLPLLLVDVDGVLSLFGFDLAAPPAGRFHAVEGVPHFISQVAGELLVGLAASFELVWASGWEERANDHLRPLIELPADLPFLRFARAGTPGASLRAHWKLQAIDSHSGARPLAWIDDAFNYACERWAAERDAPTLLVATEPSIGLTATHAQELERWATALQPSPRPRRSRWARDG